MLSKYSAPFASILSEPRPGFVLTVFSVNQIFLRMNAKRLPVDGFRLSPCLPGKALGCRPAKWAAQREARFGFRSRVLVPQGLNFPIPFLASHERRDYALR